MDVWPRPGIVIGYRRDGTEVSLHDPWRRPEYGRPGPGTSTVEVDHVVREGAVIVAYGRGPTGKTVRFLGAGVTSPSHAHVAPEISLEPVRLPWWELLRDMDG